MMTNRLFTTRAFPWVVLILVMVITGLIRFRLLSVPLERDEGEYAYVGQLILEGIPPYRDAYTMKLPGIYAAYAVIMAIFGQTHQGIHTGLLIINEVTIVLVFLLARRLLDSPAAAVSAMVFAVFSIGQWVHGIFANAEHFVILFAAAGLVVMLWALDRDRPAGFFIAGALLGAGFIMKQHGAVFPFFAVIYLFLSDGFQKSLRWRKSAGRISLLLAGIMAVVLCAGLILLWAGVFENFWFWNVVYAKSYVSQISFREGFKGLINKFSAIIISSPMLWIFSGIGLICLAFKKIDKNKIIFLLLFALFSFLSVCPGFYFRPHYFILLLPCAALLAGTAFYVFSVRLPAVLQQKVLLRALPAMLVTAGLGHSLYQQRSYLFRLPPQSVSRDTYWPNPFVESVEIGSLIRKYTDASDSIAVLGSEPQIFFYARRHSATGYIYMYPLMERHPDVLRMQKECIQQIEDKKPKFLVFIAVSYSWGYKDYSCSYFLDWSIDYYRQYYRQLLTVELHEDRNVIHQYPDATDNLPCENGLFVFVRKKNP